MKPKYDSVMLVLFSSGAGKLPFQKIQENTLTLKFRYPTQLENQSNSRLMVDYHFVDEKQDLINENQFCEYAKIFGNYYGTQENQLKFFRIKIIIFCLTLIGRHSTISKIEI